ncbi:MAG: dioxygenase [Bacteroidota bacterium]
MSNPRLAEVTTAVVKSISQALSDQKVTNDEFFAAVGFLTDLTQRGELGLLTDALALTRVVDDNTHPFEAEGATATNVLGPYYREGAPFIENGGSVSPDNEPGEPLYISGRVVGLDGNPIENAVIEVWQSNAQGEYEHQTSGKEDYYLRRALKTDGDGRYEFRTIKPSPYEIPKEGPVGTLLNMLDWHAFRPAHIHFKIAGDSHPTLVTQLYFTDDEWLHNDRVNAAKDSLAVPITAKGDHLEATFDVTLI